MACKVVASHGFEQATVARIARAAGYTTGMVAHYYESKQDIILAALRLILVRIEERLTRERESGEATLLNVLSEALALDAQRFTECAFWMAFWGQVSTDKKLKRLNAWVHREYMRLFTRCFAEHWPGWSELPRSDRDQLLRSVVTFINGLTVLTGLRELVLAEVKALLFGVMAGLVGCYRGLTVKGGPKGVGNAVNETVVYAFICLFVINVVMTAVGVKITAK